MCRRVKAAAMPPIRAKRTALLRSEGNKKHQREEKETCVQKENKAYIIEYKLCSAQHFVTLLNGFSLWLFCCCESVQIPFLAFSFRWENICRRRFLFRHKLKVCSETEGRVQLPQRGRANSICYKYFNIFNEFLCATLESCSLSGVEIIVSSCNHSLNVHSLYENVQHGAKKTQTSTDSTLFVFFVLFKAMSEQV